MGRRRKRWSLDDDAKFYTRLLLGISLVFQAASCLIFIFVPFGFDHPSTYGLDSGHAIVLFCLYVVAALAGIVIAAAQKLIWLYWAQLVAPAVIVLLMMVGVIQA